MDTAEMVWIVVAVVVVLALIALVAWLVSRKKRQAEQAERAERASELRDKAERQAQVLPDAELRAKEEQLKAEKLQREAEHAQERAKNAETDYLQQAARHEDHVREADQLDPHGTATTRRTQSEDLDADAGDHHRTQDRAHDTAQDPVQDEDPGSSTPGAHRA